MKLKKILIVSISVGVPLLLILGGALLCDLTVFKALGNVCIATGAFILAFAVCVFKS